MSVKMARYRTHYFTARVTYFSLVFIGDGVHFWFKAGELGVRKAFCIYEIQLRNPEIRVNINQNL